MVHLTCRKDRVQSPITKEGWYLFRIKSDDNSTFTLIIQNEEWLLECDVEDLKGSPQYLPYGSARLSM